MIDIKIDNDTYQLPSSANDMTQEQLLYLANLVSKTKEYRRDKIHIIKLLTDKFTPSSYRQ